MRRLIPALVVAVTVLGLAACQAPPVPTPTPRLARVATPTPPTLPAEREASFALHFEYGVCYTHVLDTEAGTFARQVQGEPHVEVPLVLSEADMEAIYAKLLAIDFLSYPARFVVPVPTNGIVIEVMPWTSYQLTVHSGEVSHTVAWEDRDPRSNHPAAEQLRELFRLISGMVERRAEVWALPMPNVGCV